MRFVCVVSLLCMFGRKDGLPTVPPATPTVGVPAPVNSPPAAANRPPTASTSDGSQFTGRLIDTYSNVNELVFRGEGCTDFRFVR